MEGYFFYFKFVIYNNKNTQTCKKQQTNTLDSHQLLKYLNLQSMTKLIKSMTKLTTKHTTQLFFIFFL